MKENMTTYIKKNGMKSFLAEPFGIIDGLVLCQISYYKYEKELFQGMEFRHTVREGLEKDTDALLEGILMMKGDGELIELMKKRGRLGNLKAANYVEEFDYEKEEQFSAITFELEKGIYYIAFRGTDNSVIGWKEDFNLSYQEEIPAQKEAVRYAMSMMETYPGKYYLGGHSKGGNLAVYTAMKLPKEQKANILGIHNFDGPGFAKEVYESEEYREIRPYVCKILPESSVVGMLWEEDDNYRVVKSREEGLLQHNPYNWCTSGCDFEYLDEIDEFAKFFKRTFDAWLMEHDYQERQRMVDTIFDIIYSAGIVSFREMTNQKREKAEALLESLYRAESEEKKFVVNSLRRLLEISAEEIKSMNSTKIKEKLSLQWKKD